MITVKATREGKAGGVTATGYVIDCAVPFVALPAESAKGRFVRITNPATQKSAIAWVADVGPWFIDDDAYVQGGERPRAESSPRTNGAGIDLGEKIWHQLGMTDNTPVCWEFIA